MELSFEWLKNNDSDHPYIYIENPLADKTVLNLLMWKLLDKLN